VGGAGRSLGAARVKLEELQPGLELGPSSWIDVPQERIDAFAKATEDGQSFHIDPELAAKGPFGTTVAHGYLTLSLLPSASYELMPVDGTVINYGLNRVRFPAPVPAGSRVRARFRIDEVEPVDGGVQVTMTATVEREHGDRPVCTAEVLFRYLT
jgi:acyl dehydratase